MNIEKIKSRLKQITDSTDGWDRGLLTIEISTRGIERWKVYKDPTHQGGVRQMIAAGSGLPLLESYIDTKETRRETSN